MITADQLVEVGRFGQPHGIKGEINALIDTEFDVDDLGCIVVDMDGIFVPFFVSGCRQRGAESFLLTLDDVTDESLAATFRGKKIYAPADRLSGYVPAGEELEDDDPDGFYAEDLIGFAVSDPDSGLKGVVVDIDDSTENALFVIETADSRTVLVPIADELIAEIDTDNKNIEFDLPTGLIDL